MSRTVSHLNFNEGGINMNKQFKIFTAVIILLCGGVTVSAQQSFRTGYFMEGYAFRYKFNPSFQGERNYISIGVGNINTGIESNMGFSTFMYPVDGSLATFLHPSVDADEFLGKLHTVNNLNLDLDLNVLAVGFRSGKSYHTIDLSLRSMERSSLPYDLFKFVKVGSTDGTGIYNISDIGLKSDIFLQASYGYSRSIFKALEIGARFKLLFGVASAQLNVSDASLQANAEKWAVKADGTLSFRLPAGIDFQTKGEAGTAETAAEKDVLDFGSLTAPDDFKSVLKGGIPGFGGAIDLGATLHFSKYFTASLSILDIGGIYWNRNSNWALPGKEWSFSGFDNIAMSEDSAAQPVGDQIDAMIEDLGDCFTFRKSAEKKSFDMLPVTINAGLQVRMPFWQRLSVGVMGEAKLDGPFSFYEGRAIVGLEPLNFLSIHGSYAYSNMGQSFGAAFNIHAPVVNFFVGVDNFLTFNEVTPQYIPVGKINTSISAGLTIAFGKKHSIFGKKAILPLYAFK